MITASTIGPKPETTLNLSLPHPLLPDLTTLASATAERHGFEMVSVQVLTHLQPMTLQIQIRCSNGEDVSLDDCAGFSAPMGEAIEGSSLLTEAYVLEISSPGIGDRLQSDRDFQTFRSYPVDVVYTEATVTSNVSQGHCWSAPQITYRSTCAAGSNASHGIQ